MGCAFHTVFHRSLSVLSTGHFLHCKPVADKNRGREENFRVSNTLFGHIASRQFGNVRKVLILTQELVLPRPCLDELGKSLVFETPRQCRNVRNGRVPTILLDKRKQGIMRYGTLQMDVQLYLGNSLIPRHSAAPLLSCAAGSPGTSPSPLRIPRSSPGNTRITPPPA